MIVLACFRRNCPTLRSRSSRLRRVGWWRRGAGRLRHPIRQSMPASGQCRRKAQAVRSVAVQRSDGIASPLASAPRRQEVGIPQQTCDKNSVMLWHGYAVVYSLQRATQHDPCLHHKFQRLFKVRLEGNPAAWRRVSQAQALWCLGLFISSGLTQGQSLCQILTPLIQTMCHS